jgi:hypothetical protein
MDDEYLSADDILNADDFEYTVVTIEKWAGGSKKKLRLRSMSAAQVLKFNSENQNTEDPELRKRILARAVINSACDKNGKLIFNDEQAEALMGKNLKNLIAVQDEFIKLNGMSKEAAVKIEADAKNASGEAPIGASPTA